MAPLLGRVPLGGTPLGSTLRLAFHAGCRPGYDPGALRLQLDDQCMLVQFVPRRPLALPVVLNPGLRGVRRESMLPAHCDHIRCFVSNRNRVRHLPFRLQDALEAEAEVSGRALRGSSVLIPESTTSRPLINH